MTDADKARQFPSDMPPGEVAKRAGVSRQTVQNSRKRSSTRGRPRKTVHPAEACARYLEKEADRTPFGTFGPSALRHVADEIRAGAWKEYLK
jgi:hypothetical protein